MNADSGSAAMTPAEEEQIGRFARSLAGPVRIGLRPEAGERGEAFRRFCDDLSRRVAGLSVETRKADDQGGAALEIAPRLIYRAVPLGGELAPFLRLLAAANGGRPAPLPPAVDAPMGDVRVPAALDVFIAPGCPFCPAAVEQVAALALHSDRISVRVIDAVMFPRAAGESRVRATPTVVLEDRLRWSGPVVLPDIVRMIADRDPRTLSAASLINMVENGNAGDIARMMLDAHALFPAFVELLVHDKWPVRLGAMVAMETIAAEDAELAALAVDRLWDRFDGVPDPVRGDILYLFGESGCPRAVEKLRAVLNGDYAAEVKEAAGEALETLTAP